MKKLIYNLIILILLIGCSKNDTDETSCIPKPNIIEVNIVNKLDDKNVFSTGLFTQNQLVIVTNPVNQFPINFNQEPNLNNFKLEPLKIVGNINFSIQLNNQVTIPMSVKIIKNTNCGEFYYFENFISNDLNYEIEFINNNLKIKI
jgi:Tfp pilus assembly protein PilP